MKTKLKKLSKRTVSILLSLLMVISTITVGVVATNAALAGESVGATDKVIYLSDPNIYWDKDGAKFDAWVWGGSQTSQWKDFSVVDSTNHVYSITVKSDFTGMNIYRRSSEHASHDFDSNQWGKIGDISADSTKNCYELTSYSGGSWTTYTPPTPQTVNYGVHSSGNGTLAVSPATSTGASGGTINSGTSVTFTAAPSSGYAVEGWYSDSACTTAISGASGTTYTTTISGTTNVYVKFTEATWPPFNYSNSDSNKLRYAHSTTSNDIKDDSCSYWDSELKTDGSGHWWIDITDNISNFVTDLANSPYKKLFFRLENSSGNTWYTSVSVSTTNAPGVSASNGSTNQDNTTYNFAAITGIESGYTVTHIGAYMYVSDNTLYVDIYSDGTNAANNNVYFKGLAGKWEDDSSTWRQATASGDEYIYTVTSNDIVKGDSGEGFYYRIVYQGTEYRPTTTGADSHGNVLVSETAVNATTGSESAFYFAKSEVGATIHAKMVSGTLTTWITPAHTYYPTPEYYIVGRFKVKAGSASGTEYYTKNGSDQSWSSTLTDSSAYFKFTQDSTTTTDGTTTTLYSLHTYETLDELSPKVYPGETKKTPYAFVVYDRNYWFGESSNSGKGASFVNYRAETSAMSLLKFANLTDNNEMYFNDPDNQNGTVVLHLKVTGITGSGGTIDTGTALYSLWYTMENAKPYAVDGAKLTAAPAKVEKGGNVKLTATYTTAYSQAADLRYTFQRYNGSAWVNIASAQTENTFTYVENNVGTNQYRVLISSVTQENSADKYYPRAATAEGECYEAGLYMSNAITTIPDNTTWDDTDLKNQSLYKRTTASSYTKSNPYEFALSTISGSFDTNAPLYTLDKNGKNQNCTIEYSTEVVTIDGVEKAVRTYKVIPNTKCSNPTIFLDITNKDVYAVCDYNGATEGKTSDYDSKEFVTYYFAEQVGHENDTNASTTAHQNTAGNGKGMRIRYWNASTQTGSSASDAMGTVDVYEQAKVRKSDGTYTANTIYVNTDELYAKEVSGNKQFYVYKVALPVRATSFSFINSSGNPIKGGFLNSLDMSRTVASNTLNPNRIYLYYYSDTGAASYESDDYISFKGIILDDHLWTTNTSSNATNQVTTRNVDANLINYTDLGGGNPRDGLGDKALNKALKSAYTANGTPHALYFGDFTTYGTLSGYDNYVHWKNVAQHAESGGKAYYAVTKDLVGMTLSNTQKNTLGYAMLLDTQGNNASTGISNAKIMPLFDYNNLTKSYSGNKIASSVYQGLHFPMNQSTYNGVTTYSYDSTTDYNRVYGTSDFEVQSGRSGTGYYKNYAYGHDGENKGDTGFFPFGGNSNQVDNTGFGTEFDLKFYMTNTGYLTHSDGTTHEDISFNFSGDDDVWVYVDGVKVLDLGGAHKTAAASINFTDMKVYYKAAGNSANGGGITSTTDAWAYSNDYVKTVDLSELLSAYGQDFDPTDATKQHTLQMFYMERGTYESNCSLSYNLPQASGLSVKNTIRVNYVNPALKNAALYSATPDYFTYQLSAKEATAVPAGISGVPTTLTNGRELSNLLPQYPYEYDTYYTYDDGEHAAISYQLSKEHSGSTSGGLIPNYNNSSYTVAGGVVYALSGNVTATTEGKAFPTGKTNNDGSFYLLNNQMANFDNKVPANSYVIVAQKQALGEAGKDNNGLLAYDTVENNNVGNYYLTSYSVYDEKKKDYIVAETALPLKYGNDDTYYAKQSFSGDDANAFYFANYSGNADDPNSAMRVDFYNDIAVGDIRIEKKLDDNSTSNSIFRFDIEFAGVFGDDTDSTWTKYDGLEYWVYNENGDLVYPSAQYYTTRTGIQLRAGEYALIKGVPVETRYKVTERSTVGFSFKNYDLKTYSNGNNTEVSVTYGGNTYKYSDSSNSSMTTDSDNVLYTEGTGDDAFKYYKTMIPPVSQTQVTTGDRETYGATAKLVYTNTKENITIVFKYYDRDTTNNKPAAIKDSPTEYSYKFDNLEKYTYYKGINDSAKAAAFAAKWSTGDKAYSNLAVGDFVCIDFEAILKEKAVAFATDSQVQNIIDEYHMWTTQAAAKAAMQTYANLQADNTGETKYTEAQAEYHTQSNGTPNTSGEKWVTYYNSSGTAVNAENFAANAQTDFDSVKSIVVWLYNEPKSYAVNVWGATDESYIHSIDTAKNVSGAYIANTTGTYSKNSTNAYYSQRIGRTTSDLDYLDALAYMKAYNFSGVVPNFVPGKMTAKTIALSNGTTLQFAYWSYNDDGSTVASTEYNYGYRITNNVDLYAVYASEKMSNDVHGLTITQDKDDVYVDVAADGTGVSRTRLNVMFTPYNCPDYDTNIKYAGLVNIYVTNLVKQLRAQSKTDEQIEETIKGLQAKYADQLKSYLATYSAFSQTLNYNNITPTITLTAKGYVYNALGTGSPSVQLTNKNRVEFTTDFKTSALYPDESHANHNCVGILQIGAMCYDDDGTLETTDWILSDNCIVRLFTDED